MQHNRVCHLHSNSHLLNHLRLHCHLQSHLHSHSYIHLAHKMLLILHRTHKVLLDLQVDPEKKVAPVVSAPLRELYASEPVNKDQELLRKSPKTRRLLIRRWNATTGLIGPMRKGHNDLLRRHFNHLILSSLDP